MNQSDPHNEPRHSPVKAALVALFRPVTAVRRGDHLALGWAWLVHGVGVAMVLSVILVLTAWSDVRGRVPATPIRVVRSLKRLLSDMVAELDSAPGWVLLIFTVLFVEFCLWFTAVVAMSWSAREEPLRASYRRSVRRLMLLTPHAATVVAGVGSVMVWLSRLETAWWRRTSGDKWDAVPWYVAYAENIAMALVAFGCLWSLVIFLKALGCRVPPAMSRWPARCEGCGYQLTGTHKDSDCPECGLAVSATIGCDIRLGTVTPGRGWCWVSGWWLAQSYQAVRRPTALGKKLHVLSPDRGHRLCLAVTLGVLMLSAPLAMGLVYYMVESPTRPRGGINWRELVEVTLMGGTILGLLMVATTAGVALLGAGIIGSVEGRRHGRNLMPAAVRAACYTSAFALLWAGVFWVNLIVLIVVMFDGLLNQIAAQYNIDMELLVFFWQFGLLGVGLMIYLALIGRATQAARYANW